MKKFYFVVLLVFFCASFSLAQTVTSDRLLSSIKKPVKEYMQRLDCRKQFKIRKHKLSGSSAFRSKAKANDDVITEQPSGILYDGMYKTSSSFEVIDSYVFPFDIDGAASQVVVSDDGTLYVRDMFSLAMKGLDSNYWLKAEKAEGDTVVFKASQAAFDYVDEDGTPYTFYANKIRMVENGEGYEFVIDTEDPDMKFVWRNDSLIQAEMEDGEFYGLVYEDGYWTGVGDYNMVMDKIQEKAAVIPSDVKVEDFQVRFIDGEDNEDGSSVKVGIDGSDIYLGNLPNQAEGTWIKGAVEGGKVILKSGQYVGVDESIGYHVFFAAAGTKTVYDDYYEEYYDSLYFTDEAVFEYDAAAKTLKSADNLMLNAGNKAVGCIQLLKSPEMRLWTTRGLAAVPEDPVFKTFEPYNDDFGMGMASIVLPKFDKDGNYLDPENMYYNIYLDDNLFTFTPGVYMNITEDITDVPYTFNDDFDIIVRGSVHDIYYYVGGFERFGVQLFYNAGGETNASRLVYYGDTSSGIDKAVSDGSEAVKCVKYTDLSGRTVTSPVGGIYLKTVKYADGSVRTTKVSVRK